MRKRLLAFLVSLTVLLGVMPGLPVFAEDFIDITFHFGTIENPDVIDPVVISVTTGTQYGEITSSPEYQAAVASLSEALNLDGLQFFNYATKRSLKDIGSWDGFKETDSTLIDDRFTENTVLYETALLPITSAEATIASPVCGTSSETKPEVTVPSGKGYGVCIYEEETGEEPYKVTFEGGKTYHAWFDLEADLGYYFQIPTDGSTVTVNNGTKNNCESYERICTVQVSVTAEHNWSEWNTVKQATATESGSETRACSGCETNETREIPATGEDSVQYRVKDEDIWTFQGLSGGAPWTSSSGQSADTHGFGFTCVGGDDSETIGMFTGASVTSKATGNTTTISISEGTATGGILVLDNGTKVAEYAAGSVIITLYDSYLKTLEPGEYTLTAYFKGDKSTSTTFSIAAAEAATKAGTAVPATGEDISYTMILGGALVCVSVLGVALFLDKKRLGKKDAK